MTEKEITKEVCDSARNLGACRLIDDINNIEVLCRYIFRPQGIEFCTIHQFPSLQVLREHKDIVREYGYYIDCGHISRSNDINIVIAGNTIAELNYNKCSCLNKIVLMHGASVTINASNYAVLQIYQIGECEVVINKDETSIVL